MLRALTYSKSIFNGIIMIILDIRTWYNFCGLDCQKGKKEKNLQVLWDVFLMLWTIWGLGRDNITIIENGTCISPTPINYATY